MKTSFIWEELRNNKCPVITCSGKLVINIEKDQWFCTDCKFLMVDWKLQEIKKGRESSLYKNKANKWKKLSKSKDDRKKRMLYAVQLQEKERQWNLIQMDRKKK